MCLLEHLSTTASTVGNNTTVLEEWSCPHADDVFKYQAYKITYLLVFPVALLCNFGALLVFFRQSSRRYELTPVLHLH